MGIRHVTQRALVACGVAEFNVGEFRGHRHDIVFKSKACRKDDVAALLYKFSQRRFTFGVFRSVEFVNDLIITKTKFALHFFGSEVVVVGISHVTWISDVDKTELDVVKRHAVARRWRCRGSF